MFFNYRQPSTTANGQSGRLSALAFSLVFKAAFTLCCLSVVSNPVFERRFSRNYLPKKKNCLYKTNVTTPT